MKALVLLTDGYSSRGGIAKFNRDLLTALGSYPNLDRVEAITLTGADHQEGSVKTKTAEGNKGRFVATATVRGAQLGPDVMFCGHINLLPVAYPLAKSLGAKLALIIHGCDAWKPTASALVNTFAPRVDRFVAVSGVTRDRFLKWTGLDPKRAFVLPNTIDVSRFEPGPKPDYLLERYQLRDRKVMLTMARMSSQEKYKGFDEVLEVMPKLIEEHPSLTYLLTGDGDDQPRLEQKARDLNIDERVIFAGYIDEKEKVDHYRLADLFVMPGRGEGFGIVYLEALASGVPVVGSLVDGSKDALRDGALGALVDPDDLDQVAETISRCLHDPPTAPPEGLDYFSEEAYAERVHRLLNEILPS